MQCRFDLQFVDQRRGGGQFNILEQRHEHGPGCVESDAKADPPSRRGSIHFNLINPDTGNRIRMITQDAETEQPLSRKDLVKGYEFKKDTYVLLIDEDFASVKVESSSTMVIKKFVEAGSIDPLYYDSSYFLAPDGKAGLDVYAVLYEAIEKTGRVALSRVVIAQRERTVAPRPMKGGLAAHTLHEQRDVNDAQAVFEEITGINTDPDMVNLATQLIDRQTGTYDPSDIEDKYETRLRALIDAKLKGEGVEEEPMEEPDRGNVVDLMAALRKSLGQGSGEPDKAEPVAKGKKTETPAKERKKPAAAKPSENGPRRPLPRFRRLPIDEAAPAGPSHQGKRRSRFRARSACGRARDHPPRIRGKVLCPSFWLYVE
jgi:DNA end-binding protein Ku